MYKTEAQIVSYGSLYLNPSSHQLLVISSKVTANDLVAPTACLEAINWLRWLPPVLLFCVYIGSMCLNSNILLIWRLALVGIYMV